MNQKDSTTISFQPLSGAKNENPFAYLLHIDEFTILLDCGWSDSFDLTEIQNICECCDRVDAVLLSHPCIEHIGALPYLCQHKGLSAPIFATNPIVTLGAYMLYDHYCNRLEESVFDLFNANDIKKTFDSITSMMYEQEKELANNIVITPYKSGRSIGGSVWRIVKGQKEIIYANSIYNKKEMHLDGFNSDLISTWHPTLWIVDSRASNLSNSKKQREVSPLDFAIQILKKLSDGRIVLFPVDGLSRTLELLYRLNAKWVEVGAQFPIYFLTHSSSLILNTVNQMSEWLSKDLVEKAVSTIEAQFELKCVKCVTDINEIQIQGPMVIVTTSDTLERGNSRKIFLKFVGNQPQNAVCFITHEPKNSLAENLRLDNTHRTLQLVERYREPLEGDELLEYKRKKEMERNEAVIEAASDSDQDDDDESSDDDIRSVVSVNQLNLKSKFQFNLPFVPKITDYGVEIDHQEYAKGIGQRAIINEKSATAKGLQQPVYYAVMEEPEDVPCKFIEKSIDFNYRASSIDLQYCFEARTDFFTLQGYIKKASPSHVIIIGGTIEATMKLNDVLMDTLGNTTVLTPNEMETVYLSQDSSSMKINISRALYNRLDFKKYDEHNQVAYIDALLSTDDISGITSAKPVEVSKPHHANFIGKIDMPVIREKLIQMEMKVSGEGELICGTRKIKVRQVSEDRLSIDGEMCVDFIKIRNLVQSLLPMV
ncbi:cleavage and polyadenylation specificity factor subunit 2 [Histomonas meleagridis]|uniref:cleavage and polyadenylation specificity factor subunit 2 n=1 Tax=Histomonas meleagridis TaxID=135588 RepID=UPI0035597A41|nr:cleavage and polyadenylation specificity factor subunit 2 [Histomonas meleagridis]KAH0799291.1 cleavage and polyadenylation specificity factor subunit 2 [Histomonas meleagridis]